MSIKYVIRNIAVQPTKFCNLDCTYCYLPFRTKNTRMSSDICLRLADQIRELSESDLVTPVKIAFHGGEPLAAGTVNFEQLVIPFESLRRDGLIEYTLQTNATLITKEWCAFFEKYRIHVGVSIDGPRECNILRKDKRGRESYDEIMKGIRLLKQYRIPFSCIAVVDNQSVDSPELLYDFFLGLGCYQVGFNFVEIMGINEGGSKSGDEKVLDFWSRVYAHWRINPGIKIRELTDTLLRMSFDEEENHEALYDSEKDLFPCISAEGNIVLLSPEFMDGSGTDATQLVVGTVYDTSLKKILESAHDVSYVNDFSEGVDKCRDECDYFAYCKGGMAANKLYEHGTSNATLTTFCKNSVIHVVEGILTGIEN